MTKTDGRRKPNQGLWGPALMGLKATLWTAQTDLLSVTRALAIPHKDTYVAFYRDSHRGKAATYRRQVMEYLYRRIREQHTETALEQTLTANQKEQP